MKEIWYDLIGYEQYYEISNLGRFRSKSRFVKGKNNSSVLKSSRILTIKQHSGGYSYVQLCINSKEKNITTHRYIALHFIPNPSNKPFINHINGIKTDNRIENLEWVTASENMQHAFDTGLQEGRKGTSHHSSKLSEQDVLDIRRRILTEKAADLAKEYNIHKSTLNSIKLRKKWKHI